MNPSHDLARLRAPVLLVGLTMILGCGKDPVQVPPAKSLSEQKAGTHRLSVSVPGVGDLKYGPQSARRV